MTEPPPPPVHHFPSAVHHSSPVMETFADEFEAPVEYEERRPTVQQRLSELSLDDGIPDLQPRAERRRTSPVPAITQDYIYYRFNKVGEDWSSPIRTTVSAPVAEIERRARKGHSNGTVLEQLTRMSPLRRERIEEAVRSANAREAGDAHWTVVYINSKKILRRPRTIVVPEMDVILARTKKPRARLQPRSGEPVNPVKQTRSAKAKDKNYTDDTHRRLREDSGLAVLADPIGNLTLFDMDGRPRDEHGPIHFNNAGLPPQIPREKPLGAKPGGQKEGNGGKRDKSQKRSKSRDKGPAHEDGIFVVGGGGDFDDGPDPPPVDAMFGEVPSDKRGRRGKSPHHHPEVVTGDNSRSYSRRRAQSQSRGQSRDKSRLRRGPVHFPNQHTQQYFDPGSSSSEVSESSHYGVEYAESSNTSLGSPGGVPRRGSLVHLQPRPDTDYKKHHRGPVRSISYTERPYHGEQHIVTPARSRRDSYIAYGRPAEGTRYERLPRPAIQIVYHEPVTPTRSQHVIPARPLSGVPLTRFASADSGMPILHYPDEERERERERYYRDEVDRHSSRIEDYERDRIREDLLEQRERYVSARERDLDLQEELRRLRLQPEREYYDDHRDRSERRGLRPAYYDGVPRGYYYYDD